ncbi:AraC family transcriptional regulator [Mucilaginibacter sp. FT3.2]|uniref:AraC family transcriptional regulator n=1 Tax=Mucilaginibacter sp. FT3.2 TaxID=2723090 RepID=UPI00161808F2|nr:helix-turn-helix domain-containing protein [Mucilaginibacter sp. FT3.2]MBB6233067.1 AraC-like DNA-binding protein [Mucilaginibacter sp. FT3.2]
MQLQPSPILSTVVKHYLVIECQADVYANYRIFSDGNPGMVFHFKRPLLQYNTGDITPKLQPECFVYGQITNYNNLCSAEEIGMLVVVLQPYALFSLFKMAAHEVLNATINLVDLLGSEARELEEKVMEALSMTDAIAIVERFLIRRVTRWDDGDSNVFLALNHIYTQKGMVNISNLLKVVPVTERQLERKFKEWIGISPKKMADVVRLQNFLKSLQKHPFYDNIALLSYSYGYYDQAHFNNYFKKHTGITPLQYKANNRLLTLNLMAVNK